MPTHRFCDDPRHILSLHEPSLTRLEALTFRGAGLQHYAWGPFGVEPSSTRGREVKTAVHVRALRQEVALLALYWNSLGGGH